MKRNLPLLLAFLVGAPASAFDAVLRERLAAAPVPAVGPVLASSPAAGDGLETRNGGFLDPETLPAVIGFPPPPLAGSPAYLADFAELHLWQLRRTDAQCAAAQAESSASYERLMGPVSPFPTPLDGEVKVFFAAVGGTAGAATVLLKRRFGRPRPPLTDRTLRPCISLPGGKAYPSGHASVSRLYALVLAELVPARRAEFLARADQAALNRVIGGVHHPSDTAAGKRLADDLHAALRAEPKYRDALERVRRRLP